MRGMAETLVHSRQGCGGGAAGLGSGAFRPRAPEKTGGRNVGTGSAASASCQLPAPSGGDQCINTSISCRCDSKSITEGNPERSAASVSLLESCHHT